MASSKEYLDFILEQLSELEEITYRSMMGEYIIYTILASTRISNEKQVEKL